MKSLPEQPHHLLPTVMVMVAPFVVILRVNEVCWATQANYRALGRNRRNAKRRQSSKFPAC